MSGWEPEYAALFQKLRQLVESRIVSGNPVQEVCIGQQSETRPACEDADWLQEHVQVQWVDMDEWDKSFDLPW